MNLKAWAKQLIQDIPLVFVALKDCDTPMLAKFFAGLTLIYALSPIDLVPDFIPILGYLDDVILLPLLIALTIKCIPEQVLDKVRRQASSQGISRPHQHWIYAIPIMLIWVYLLVWVATSLGWLTRDHLTHEFFQ